MNILVEMFFNDVCVCAVTSVVSYSFDLMDRSPPGSSVHGDSPGKNTGVGCHALLQGFFNDTGMQNTNVPKEKKILLLKFNSFKHFYTISLFIWPHWVFVSAFSSRSEWGLLSSCNVQISYCGCFSCCSFSSCAWGYCPRTFGIFPDQGLNLCPLHWQVDS